MAKKPNMAVSLTVMIDFVQNPDGSWKAVGNYAGSSIPPAKPGMSVVSPDGNIDLTAIDRDKKAFTKDTDIMFWLGNAEAKTYYFTHDPSNPTDASQAIKIADDKDKDKYTAELGANNPWLLHLLDQDDGGDQAGYQLFVTLFPDGNHVNGINLPIDPIIINRGIGD